MFGKVLAISSLTAHSNWGVQQATGKTSVARPHKKATCSSLEKR